MPAFSRDSCGNGRYRCVCVVADFGNVLVADEMFDC